MTLRELRKAAGYRSAGDLASQLGLNGAALRNVEKGVAMLSRQTAVRLSRHVGASSREIVWACAAQRVIYLNAELARMRRVLAQLSCSRLRARLRSPRLRRPR